MKMVKTSFTHVWKEGLLIDDFLWRILKYVFNVHFDEHFFLNGLVQPPTRML